ncbi:MAG: lipoprotein transmembrane [Sphingomonadales bacterium 32-68-7]|nr:MAG: lipoprotein transmembrane [Sphingomonadales bacterium 12-68-11]OYX10226.1 MAG: lipoprotein transmembrane [Sphingomonadales bacterium 32-68-7]
MSKIAKIVRGTKLAFAPLALGALAACASGFNADVSRFESQLPAPQGQTFAVVADDQRLAGGLEFSRYAQVVSDKMAALGYRPVANVSEATLVVRFDYGVDRGRERIRSSIRDPFYDSWYSYQPVAYRDRNGNVRVTYVPTRQWGYGWNDPWLNDVDSYTVYTSGIELKIDRASDGQRLFEGKAEAASLSNRLQYLVPNLVEAMFTDFPGNSGETVRISVAPEDQPVQRGRR